MRFKFNFGCIVFFILITSHICFSQEQIIDGIPNIINPDKGSNSNLKFIFKKQLVIGGEEESEDYIFERLIDFTVDEKGNIYLLDFSACSVFIFDSEGNYLRTVGRKGQGPGEFTYPIAISSINPDTFFVAQSNPNRFSFFNFKGEYLRDFSLNFMGSFAKAKMFEEGSILFSKSEFQMGEKKPSMKLSLNLIDFIGENKKSLFQTEREMNFLNTKKFSQKDTPIIFWCYDETGNIYVVDDMFDYRIKVLDQQGKLVKVIQKKFKPLKKTKEEQEQEIQKFDEAMKRTGVDAGFKYEPDKTKPIISQIFTDDLNRFWVNTLEGASESGMAFDIFDNNGKYLNKITTDFKAGGNILIKKNFMYYIYQDEEELPAFFKYKIIEK